MDLCRCPFAALIAYRGDSAPRARDRGWDPSKGVGGPPPGGVQRGSNLPRIGRVNRREAGRPRGSVPPCKEGYAGGTEAETPFSAFRHAADIAAQDDETPFSAPRGPCPGCGLSFSRRTCCIVQDCSTRSNQHPAQHIKEPVTGCGLSCGHPEVSSRQPPAVGALVCEGPSRPIGATAAGYLTVVEHFKSILMGH